MIHDDRDFTLSGVLHSVAAVVLTATGDGQTIIGHTEVCFRSSGVVDPKTFKILSIINYRRVTKLKEKTCTLTAEA